MFLPHIKLNETEPAALAVREAVHVIAQRTEPVRPSELSTAAERGFRETVYKSDGTGTDEKCSLWFKQCERGLWRFFVYFDERDRFSVVGPHYKTKADLLADLERYALEYGFRNPPSDDFLNPHAAESLPIITLATGCFRPGLRGTAVFQELRTVYLGAIGQETKTTIAEYSVTINGSGVRHHCQAGRDFEFAKQKQRPTAKQLNCGHTERHDTARGSSDNVCTVLFAEHGLFHVRQTAKNPSANNPLFHESFESLDDARDRFDGAF